jgi:asparagine synthase (glutamine-hydrolysing)
MCGIIGSIGIENNTKIEEGLNAIQHRGPDFHDIYYEKNNQLALGHSRLSIIDVSQNGNQPMIFQNRYVIVFNGEIYNFQEIKELLLQKGIKFKSNSDTEVLVAMFSIYGKKMLSKINGIFAFAIWDKHLKKLFLARDYMGVKPLYYIHDKKKFVFSSEIKGILKIISSPIKANLSSVFKHLTFMWSTEQETAFSQIYKLNPGESIEIDIKKKITINKWHKESFNKINKQKLNNIDLVSEVSLKIENAVKKQLVSDVDVGILLSGGVDSSLISSIALKNNPNISAFTIFFPEGNEEEMSEDYEYAKLFAKKNSIKLNKINFSYKNIESDIEKIIYHLDEPVSDLAALNLFYISKLAKDNNHKVLMSGAGADDIFTGYRRHRAFYLKEKIGFLHEPAMKFLNLSKPVLKKIISNSNYRRISKLININYDQITNNLSNYFVWTSFDDLLKLINNDYKKSINKENIHDDFSHYLKNLPPHLSNLDKMLLIEQRFFLTEHNLDYVDKMSMANGVEVRVPFLDIDLVNYVNSLPETFKIDFFNNKKLLKKISKKYLPNEIIKRKKAGFGSPVKKLVKNNLKEIIHDTFSSTEFLNRGLFDRKNVKDLINLNFNDIEDHSHTILSLLFIELWFKRFKVCL